MQGTGRASYPVPVMVADTHARVKSRGTIYPVRSVSLHDSFKNERSGAGPRSKQR